MTEEEKNEPPTNEVLPPEGNEIREIIREELRALLPDLLPKSNEDGGTPKESFSDDSGLSAKQAESIAKKAVEEAMAYLKEIAPKTPKTPKTPEDSEKPKTQKENEELPTNPGGKKKLNLQKLLWGE
jgi:hypothetical protein